MNDERRKSRRIELDSPIEQIVDEAEHRCRATNVSRTGLYMERPVSALARRSNVVQLAFTLPGSAETLWAKAEVVYDSFDARLHGTAVRFTEMAARDRRALDLWLDAR